jgi:hypothetical protein
VSLPPPEIQLAGGQYSDPTISWRRGDELKRGVITLMTPEHGIAQTGLATQ